MRRHRSLRSSGIVGVDRGHVARPQRLELVARIAAPAPQVQRHRAVEQPGIHVRQVEMLGQRPGDRPLAARRRAVDRDQDPLRRGARVSECSVKRRALTGGHAYGKAPPAQFRRSADGPAGPHLEKLETNFHGEARMGHQAHLPQVLDPLLRSRQGQSGALHRLRQRIRARTGAEVEAADAVRAARRSAKEAPADSRSRGRGSGARRGRGAERRRRGRSRHGRRRPRGRNRGQRRRSTKG